MASIRLQKPEEPTLVPGVLYTVSKNNFSEVFESFFDCFISPAFK